MRTGLLAAGVAVAVIGVGVVLASLSLATGPVVTQFDPVSPPTVPGHAWFSQELDGVNQSTANIDLVWSSSQYLQVNLYPAVRCATGVCPSGVAVYTLWGDSGRWSTAGAFSFPLIINLSNPFNTTTTFSGTLLESYTGNSLANPTWNLFLPLLGAVVLIALGGVAVFLGLFLPKGVYSGPYGPALPYDGDEEDDEGEVREIDPLEEDETPPEQGHS